LRTRINIADPSVTQEELENSIPASSMQTSAAKNDPVVKELKRLLNELSQNQSARLGIFERLKGISESDDIGKFHSILHVYFNLLLIDR
jgi:hypothetical protein